MKTAQKEFSFMKKAVDGWAKMLLLLFPKKAVEEEGRRERQKVSVLALIPREGEAGVGTLNLSSRTSGCDC